MKMIEKYLEEPKPGYRSLAFWSLNGDLTEDELFSGIGFLDHLFDQGRLASTQKTGVDVNNCHEYASFQPFERLCNVSIYYTTICTVPQAILGKR